MLKFYPPKILAIFWAPSLVTLLTFQNAINLENTKTPKHQNGHKPCFCENVASLQPATFSQKNTDYIVCPASFVVLFLFVLVFLHVLFSLFSFFVPGNSSWLSFCAPISMVLDIVEGQGRGGGGKMAKIHYGIKT